MFFAGQISMEQVQFSFGALWFVLEGVTGGSGDEK
jgi:hypothetical protein